MRFALWGFVNCSDYGLFYLILLLASILDKVNLLLFSELTQLSNLRIAYYIWYIYILSRKYNILIDKIYTFPHLKAKVLASENSAAVQKQ
jgi:hypothetical protein